MCDCGIQDPSPGVKDWEEKDRRREGEGLLRQLGQCRMNSAGSTACAVALSMCLGIFLLENQTVISITMVSHKVSVSKCCTSLSKKQLQIFNKVDCLQHSGIDHQKEIFAVASEYSFFFVSFKQEKDEEMTKRLLQKFHSFRRTLPPQ